MPRESTSTLRVRYAETDQMGVVYHAHYLVWCEVGRTDFIRELGTTYAEIEASGVRLAVADAHVSYRAPARYDDRIRVRTWLERVQSRTVTFGYEVLRETAGQLERLATASTKLIALNERGRPVVLPAEIVERFRAAQTPDGAAE